MPKLILLCLLIFAGVVKADPPPTAPKATDPASDQSADALWSHLNILVHQLSVGVSNQDPQAKDLVPQIAATVDTLNTKFPKNGHFWEARMIAARAWDKATRNKLATALPPAKLTEEFKKIADSDASPRVYRAEASSSLIEQAMDHAGEATGDSSAQWEAIDARIVQFQKKYGDVMFDGADSPAVDLREEEVDALETSSQPARFQALVRQLSSDSNPKIAAMAKRKLATEKQLAVLKSKPFDLQFTAIDGTHVDLAQMRGKVVLVDFWATWCPDCRIDMPDVVAAYQKFHDRGFEIVGISLDKDKAKTLGFMQRNGMPWPQYFDGQVWDNKISKSFGIDFIPAAWLIDKRGMLVTTNGSEHLADKVEKALAQP